MLLSTLLSFTISFTPLPEAQPMTAKKLERVPDGSPALQQELFKFDKEFQARQRGCAALPNSRNSPTSWRSSSPTRMSKPRIWYEVAHAAAAQRQRHQTCRSRVRKYATRCLEISRDPPCSAAEPTAI